MLLFCLFLLMCDIESLFVCLLAICTSQRKIYSSLCPLWSSVLFGFLWWLNYVKFGAVFCLFWILIPSRMCDLQIFAPVLWGCFFTLWTGSFDAHIWFFREVVFVCFFSGRMCLWCSSSSLHVIPKALSPVTLILTPLKLKSFDYLC